MMTEHKQLGPLGYPISRDDFVNEGREAWHRTGFTPLQLAKRCAEMAAALDMIRTGMADDRAYRDCARAALREYAP